ncbi:magnesium/cobalt transporter CorA [Leeia sp. TBRC 13508]|uniref:Magnesium transport protein CorA n=1 Tax=Leeia speluncae TaxID=2884804 RepID=A0ABS8D759_9NEIS|nr:magnesium/cobalt transporter CorA [Leeia speluncae]MCB6184036.1 magnesium/cobalt transporter CorA [Leeia speluncae]
MTKRHRTSRQKKQGLPPGTLVHIGKVHTQTPELDWVCYSADTVARQSPTPKSLPPKTVPSQTTWLNVYGLQDSDLLRKIGETYGLHPLVQEDILNTEQRPKVEIYDQYLYVVAHLFHPDEEGQLQAEQISFVLGDHWLLTVQERSTGLFAQVRNRLLANHSQQRKGGADYLLYALLDALVDHHFALIEKLSERIEDLEDRLMEERPSTEQLAAIYREKRQLAALRKVLWPLRECLNSLTRDDADFFTAETQLYLRDVYDHAVHALESLEALRDQIAGMLDIFVSTTSNLLNKDMRVLTVIATIFMPLTLITSLYGMNFKYMPELDWHWGYFAVLGVMAAMAIGMGVFFWKRRWI